MTTTTFRRIAAGRYIDDASGVQIYRGDSGHWLVYAPTYRPIYGRGEALAATRATLAQAKVAAKAEIAKLAARREPDHAEALAEQLMRNLLSISGDQPEQIRAWNSRHELNGYVAEYADYLAAREADHAEALAMNDTIVITTPLTHAETVDNLRDYAQEHEVPYDRLEFAIMAVTGVTAKGAYALIFADSTASLADPH